MSSFIINPNDNIKRSMYFIKEILKNQETLVIRSSVNGSFVAIKIITNLKRLNYINIRLINTETVIKDKLIKSNIVFEVGKTDNFDELYKQNEIKRKEMVSIKDEKRKNLIGSIVNDINIY